MTAHPFAGVPKADPRRQRRALTVDELTLLLFAALLRPLAKYGRLTVAVDVTDKLGRQTWKKGR